MGTTYLLILGKMQTVGKESQFYPLCRGKIPLFFLYILQSKRLPTSKRLRETQIPRIIQIELVSTTFAEKLLKSYCRREGIFLLLKYEKVLENKDENIYSHKHNADDDNG